MKTNRQILTTKAYWDSIAESTKAYWQSVANTMSHRRMGGRATVCTNRPSLTEHGKGELQIRRCSTGGKWGKSADTVWINEESLLRAGYIYVTYMPKVVRIAAKREAIYSNDNH